MTPQPVTPQDARAVAAHIETVQHSTLRRIKDAIICPSGMCANCDLLRLIAEDLKRITPEHVNTIRALADRLDALQLANDDMTPY